MAMQESSAREGYDAPFSERLHVGLRKLNLRNFQGPPMKMTRIFSLSKVRAAMITSDPPDVPDETVLPRLRRVQTGPPITDTAESRRNFELRKMWVVYMGLRFRGTDIPFPEELRSLTCGARTRKGTLCKRRDLYQSARCRLHGGLSSGPTSPEGKRRSAANRKCRKPHETLTNDDIC